MTTTVTERSDEQIEDNKLILSQLSKIRMELLRHLESAECLNKMRPSYDLPVEPMQVCIERFEVALGQLDMYDTMPKP